MRKMLIVFIAVCVMSAVAFAASERQPTSADEAVALLKEGNERFVKMRMVYPNLSAERREAVATSQKPFAAVLGCSDSRVPVEEVFDRGIGDIFVIRVAGNVAMDPVVIGSAEYVADNLGVPVLIVLGHTDCGAVKAAISAPPLEGSVRDIQEKIEPVAARVEADHPGLKGDELTNAVVKANVLQAMQDLLDRSAILRRSAGEGRLRILAAVYDLDTGAIEWLE